MTAVVIRRTDARMSVVEYVREYLSLVRDGLYGWPEGSSEYALTFLELPPHGAVFVPATEREEAA